MPAQYLRRINASWYFRPRVLEDVKNHLKVPEIQKALHINSLTDARVLLLRSYCPELIHAGDEELRDFGKLDFGLILDDLVIEWEKAGR